MTADQLPAPPRPQGRYVPTSRVGSTVFTAGMTPRVDGVLQVVGQVGGEVDLERACEGATIAVRNALSAVLGAAGSLERIAGLARMTVFVNAVPSFGQHSVVADAATDALAAVLGEKGLCARSAVGVASLPDGACVEIELTAVLT